MTDGHGSVDASVPGCHASTRLHKLRAGPSWTSRPHSKGIPSRCGFGTHCGRSNATIGTPSAGELSCCNTNPNRWTENNKTSAPLSVVLLLRRAASDCSTMVDKGANCKGEETKGGDEKVANPLGSNETFECWRVCAPLAGLLALFPTSAPSATKLL